jgi:GNAT superfamily N-acetyltransferase
MTQITRDGLHTHHQQLCCQLCLPGDEEVALRLLGPGDAPILAEYFLGLSAETRRLYAPHPFDLVTAEKLCATLDVTTQLRFVGVAGKEPDQRIMAYLIVGLTPGESELRRYQDLGLTLDPERTCWLAPSVADRYQSQGVGFLLMQPILDWARQLGYRQMVLSGGTRAENHRAIRFYTKLGFRRLGDFQTEGSVDNHDMMLDLL